MSENTKAQGSELSAGLDRAGVRTWRQEGFAVVANSPIHDGLPVVEGFYLPKWEAESRLRQINDCPSELQLELQIVPATLIFRLPAPAA